MGPAGGCGSPGRVILGTWAAPKLFVPGIAQELVSGSERTANTGETLKPRLAPSDLDNPDPPGSQRNSPIMGRQIRPAKVYQMATAELRSRIMPKYQSVEPPWYSVLYNHPPAETITRTPAVKLRDANPKQKKPRNVYRPQQITFPEDALRQTFYKDHPWELARPRMILEMDGKDSYNLDWSKGVRQPGMALSGEW